MLSITVASPLEIARTLAGRVRSRRLERGWTQDELAGRAGIAAATYRRFERTGRISLERMLKLAVVLDAQEGFERLFEAPPARSLAELEKRAERSRRQRGRRRDAKA